LSTSLSRLSSEISPKWMPGEATASGGCAGAPGSLLELSLRPMIRTTFRSRLAKGATLSRPLSSSSEPRLLVLHLCESRLLHCERRLRSSERVEEALRFTKDGLF
jgi:hypothetical protein